MTNQSKLEAEYMGKKLTDMTKEELIEAVLHLGKLYEEQIQDSIQTLNFYRSLK